jgi:hypothetical protein
MKTLLEAIDVDIKAGVPRVLCINGRVHTVMRVLDSWRFRSRWWAEEEERNYWWLETETLSIIVFESVRGWYKQQVWD